MQRLVEREVTFRLGNVDFSAPQRDDHFSLNSINQSLHHHEIASNGNLNRRIAAFKNLLKKYNFDGLIRCDFSDCQSSVDRGPIVTYNRTVKSKNYILFPLLPFYHNVTSHTFRSNPADPLQFHEKVGKAYWRGTFTGHFQAGKYLKTIGNVWQDVEHDTPRSRKWIQRLSRVRLCQVGQQDSRVDAAFVKLDELGLADRPDFKGFNAPVVAKTAHFKNKYLIAASGNDVASSFPWMLNTNSIVLKESARHHCYLDRHFRPWRHYIPIKRGFTDLSDKLDWCENNQATCKEIITRANERHEEISRTEHREECDLQVLDAITKLSG